MKRLLLIFTIFITLSATAEAQSQHMKFMGIPINGTITQFGAKLKAKGFSPVSYNNMLDKGLRVYSGGTFNGYKCEILVSYIPNTNVVYSSMASIDCQTLTRAKEIYDIFQRDLLEKYFTEYANRVTTNGNPDDIGYDTYTINLFSNSGTVLGNINLYIYENETEPSLAPYSVMIVYYDESNYNAYQKQKLNDL